MEHRKSSFGWVALCVFTGIVIVALISLYCRQSMRYHAIQRLVFAIEGRTGGRWDHQIWAAHEQVEEWGLEEEALAAILPLLAKPGTAKAGAEMYIAGTVDTPRPDVVEALLRVANDPLFPETERVDAAKLVLHLRPDPSVKRIAEQILNQFENQSQEKSATP